MVDCWSAATDAIVANITKQVMKRTLSIRIVNNVQSKVKKSIENDQRIADTAKKILLHIMCFGSMATADDQQRISRIAVCPDLPVYVFEATVAVGAPIVDSSRRWEERQGRPWSNMG